MSDEWFDTAKAIVRAAWPTYDRIQALEGNKPLCRYCFVPCDWTSREWRSLHLCPYCYYETPLQIQERKKT